MGVEIVHDHASLNLKWWIWIILYLILQSLLLQMIMVMLVWIWMSERLILVGGYVKKRLQICGYWAVNTLEIGVTSGLNWYCLAHPKFMIFGVVIPWWVSFQWDLELLNMALCAQSYDQFTQDCAEYIETGNWTGIVTLRKNW